MTEQPTGPEPGLPLDLSGLQDLIEPILLGGPRRYTRAQTAAAAGVSVEQASRLWRALGFADVADAEVVFTDADVATVRAAHALVREGLIDEELEAASSRMLGQTMSRLAEWQVRLMFTILAGRPEVLADPAELAAFVDRLVPTMERIQTHVWRRQLAAYAGRALAAPGEQLQAPPRVVGFADMVGYTALSRRVSEAELGHLLERFEAAAAEVVAAHRGRVVKMLGDEVLFVADDPAGGAAIALDLVAAAAADPAVPALRVGLAHGRVLSRFGDVYGSVVNIASRLTSVARPGSVLADRELAARLRGDPRYRLRPQRAVSVRGYGHLKPWLLTRA